MSDRCFRCGRFVPQFWSWDVWSTNGLGTVLTTLNLPACPRHAGFSYGCPGATRYWIGP